MYNLFPISPHTNSVNMMNFTWCIAYCALTIFKTTVQVSAYIICNIKQSISCSDILVETKIYQIAYEISCYAFSQSDSEKYSMPNSPQKLNLKYSLIHSGLSPHQNAISLMIAYIFFAVRQKSCVRQQF